MNTKSISFQTEKDRKHMKCCPVNTKSTKYEQCGSNTEICYITLPMPTVENERYTEAGFSAVICCNSCDICASSLYLPHCEGSSSIFVAIVRAPNVKFEGAPISICCARTEYLSEIHKSFISPIRL